MILSCPYLNILRLIQHISYHRSSWCSMYSLTVRYQKLKHLSITHIFIEHQRSSPRWVKVVYPSTIRGVWISSKAHLIFTSGTHDNNT